VAPAAPACTRLETELDCSDCGACCRSAYDAVDVGRREPVVARHPALVRAHDGRLALERAGDRCAALDGELAYRCTIYDDRPRTCRDFERGGRHCLDARRRVGLSA
jgi:Fe-S-cluster containining protein